MKKIFYSSAKASMLQELDEVVDGSWLHLESPDDNDLDDIAKHFALDIDLLRDGVDPNESPRIERDGDVVYIYTRFCLAEAEKMTTAPLLIMYGKGIVMTICSQPFTNLEQILRGPKEIITSKRAQLILEILSAINGGYKRRINSVSRKIWQTRAQLDKAQIANEDFIAFIDIEEDLNDFLLVLEPMAAVLNSLLNGRFMRLYEEDKDLIEDLSLGNQELTQLAQSRLSTLRNIREAYSTITANNLNRVFKLMTSITILMGIFTLITGFYSMNISLPAARNPNAFWIILGSTMFIISMTALYFKKNRWF
jgi:magnesium transporter